MFSPTRLVRPCPGPDAGAFLQQGFFWNKHFDTSGRWTTVPAGQPGFHSGRDVACPVGTPLLAPCDGRILGAGWQDPQDHGVGLGHFVLISSARLYPAYDGKPVRVNVFLGHLSEHFVVVGTDAKAGVTTLGLSGQTGHVEGPHVHVQVQDPRGPGVIPLPFEWCDLNAYLKQKET